jgi:oligosaccharide repeat unit polymerase
MYELTSTLYFLLWGLVVLLFIVWFGYLYMKRRLITITSTTILMKIFIPLIVMYPFAFSSKNIEATGALNYDLYLNQLNKVFVISLTGTLFFIIGCYMASRVNLGHKIVNTFTFAYKSFLTKTNIVLYGIILSFIFIFMYSLGFFQTLFSGRGFGMEHAGLRPIANLFYSLCSTFIIVTLTYYYQTRSKLVIILALIGCFFSMTSGTRGGVLWAIVMFIYIYFNLHNENKKKANYPRIALLGSIILMIFIYIGDARFGQYNFITAMTSGVEKLLYGNNFSDLRDFAWVMAYWDNTFLHGKTMVSGYFSFIPSSIFPLRENWSLGNFTVTTIGYDSSSHPGLRPGIFGESYFNFGILGVCLFAFVVGFIINTISRYVQAYLHKEVQKTKAVIVVSSGYIFSNLCINLLITAGFFKVYVLLGTILLGYFYQNFVMRNRDHINYNNKRYLFK